VVTHGFSHWRGDEYILAGVSSLPVVDTASWQFSGAQSYRVAVSQYDAALQGSTFLYIRTSTKHFLVDLFNDGLNDVQNISIFRRLEMTM
jgi:hypothetical protein